MAREDELERELRSQSNRLWDLVLDQIEDNKKTIAELRKAIIENHNLINKLELDIKILAVKVSMITAIAMMIIKYLIDKVFHI